MKPQYGIGSRSPGDKGNGRHGDSSGQGKSPSRRAARFLKLTTKPPLTPEERAAILEARRQKHEII